MTRMTAVATLPFPQRAELRARSHDSMPGRSQTKEASNRRDRALPMASEATADERALQALIERAGRGDSQALGRLYDIYSPKIYRYLYRRTGNAELAEDLTASVFVRVLEAISSQHRWKESFTGWLYRIAQNQFIDHVRQAARRPQSELPDTLPCPKAAEMEEQVLRDCSTADVRSALNELRPEYATVLALRFGDELSHAEVGQMLGKSADAVKVTQHRALKSLSRKLVQRRALTAA